MRPTAIRPASGVAALLLLIVPLTTACNVTVFGERGSGNVVSESRDVSGFDRISLEGTGTVNVEVTGTESLTIEAEDNLIDNLRSRVVNGTLELDVVGSISPTTEIVYTITMASLEGLGVSGSGDITAMGIAGNRLAVDISGSGSIDAPAIEVDAVSVEISGSGAIDVTGSTGLLVLSISGSGDYDGEQLVTTTAEVHVSGSGHAVVNVTDQLDARVSGSGSIEYLGDPSINSSIAGSGDISKR